MKLALMKAIRQRQRRQTDSTNALKIHALALKIWRRLGHGVALNLEDGIGEGSKPDAWDVLGDYLTLMWMWDKQDDCCLTSELQRAYPETRGVLCQAARLYQQAANAALELDNNYEHERLGIDMSARAKMSDLKGQLALYQSGDADAIKAWRFGGREPIPYKMITRWRELLYLERKHLQGGAVRRHVKDMLRPGWALQGLSAWMFDEHFRRCLRMQS